MGSITGPRSSAVVGQARPTVALTGVALVLCLAATGAVLVVRDVSLGLRAPEVHVVLDSVDASIAILVAYLLLGRFRRDRSLRHLLLALGLSLLGFANVAGTLVASEERFTLEVWWPITLRLVGALLVAAGALVTRTVDRRETRLVMATVVTVAAGSLALLAGQGDDLPAALDTTPLVADDALITGHPVLLLSHVAGALCFLIAAVAFTAQGRHQHDEMLRWFGPACVLGMFSRLHYMLFPSIYSGWLYTGDLLRTLCYLLLLLGAAREISRYWALQPGIAVVADRKRVARELHDGVVQELGFIAAESHGLEPGRGTRIREAAHRGLDEARAAVEALDHGEEESFTIQLHRLARQLTDRYGVRVVVDLDVTVPVAGNEAHALLRIAREAAGNAARHGDASSIGIGLARDSGGRHLVVHDDGSGFDTDQVPGRGYGLTSMRDRARGLRGDLDVRSGPGRGTTVRVTW